MTLTSAVDGRWRLLHWLLYLRELAYPLDRLGVSQRSVRCGGRKKLPIQVIEHRFSGRLARSLVSMLRSLLWQQAFGFTFILGRCVLLRFVTETKLSSMV
jgi:hypothetical protein